MKPTVKPIELIEPIEPAKLSMPDEIDEANELLEGLNDPGNRIKAVELDQINVNPVLSNFDLPQVPSTSPASASLDPGFSNFDSVLIRVRSSILKTIDLSHKCLFMASISSTSITSVLAGETN